MILLISKADLPDFVKFSKNIADELINPDIRDAHEFDVLPLLTTPQYQALVEYRQLPPADVTAYLALPELEQLLSPIHKPHLLYQAVRGLLCHESHRRYLLSAGLHNTPNGLEVFAGDGHAPVTASQRTELRSDAQAKCAVYRNKLAIALRAYGDTTTYTSCTRRKPRTGQGGLKTYAV